MSVPVSKLDEIKAILLAMKEDILKEITQSKKGDESSLSTDPSGDIYDQASNERERELTLLLGDRERDKLRNIEDALQRIEDGEYGVCEECEEEIPLGRLKVMPFARHCVRCKSDIERLQAQTRRLEEDRVYRDMALSEEEEG
ncbi:MAG: TraR/DksA family transcriptional regulator [Desulfuromonadia bacterium]